MSGNGEQQQGDTPGEQSRIGFTLVAGAIRTILETAGPERAQAALDEVISFFHRMTTLLQQEITEKQHPGSRPR